MSEPKDQSMSRRKALKVLSAAAGATTLSLLPGWEKPVVGIGALPAFAQASLPLGTGDLQVTLTWNTGSEASNVDIDLHLREPGGAHVYYSTPTGPTATLDFDNTIALGPENIFVAPGHFAAGTYQVYVVYYSADAVPVPATTATIRITVFANTPQVQVRTYTRSLTTANSALGILVADVVFPGGAITETNGTRVAAVGSTPKTRR